MNREVLKKIIEIINTSIIGLRVNDFLDEKQLSISYNKLNNQYSYEIRKICNKKEKIIESKSSISLEEIIEIICKTEYASNFIKIYNERKGKERKYSEAKNHMYQLLSTINLSEEEIDIMTKVIEQVSQLPEVVGFGNRVVITSIPGAREEVRLTDETGWDNSGDVLHLQLVQVMDDCGMNFRNYPKRTFEELTKYICEKMLNKNSNKIK